MIKSELDKVLSYFIRNMVLKRLRTRRSIYKRINANIYSTGIPIIVCATGNADHCQGLLDTQIRCLRYGRSQAFQRRDISCFDLPIPDYTFLSRRFSRVNSATTSSSASAFGTQRHPLNGLSPPRKPSKTILMFYSVN